MQASGLNADNKQDRPTPLSGWHDIYVSQKSKSHNLDFSDQ